MQQNITPNAASVFTKKERRRIEQYNRKAMYREELEWADYFGRRFLIQSFIRQEARNGNKIDESDMDIRCFEEADGEDDLRRMMQIAKQNGAEYRKYRNWLSFEKFFKRYISS